MTTMPSKEDASTTVAPVDDPLRAALAAVRDVAAELGLTLVATADERERLRARIRGCPTEVIRRLAVAMTPESGAALGTTYDAPGAVAVVERHRAAQAFASQLRQLAQSIDDGVDAELADVCDESMSVLAVMKRSRNTKRGKAWHPVYQDLRKLIPTHKQASKPSSSTKDTAPSAPTTPAIEGH